MSGLSRFLPCLRWSRGYTRGDLTGDLLAGATTAAFLIPQAMAYASLAGLPPITGLYAALAPPIVYALLGTSRRLAVGPVAIDSLLTAAALAPLAAGDPLAYAAAASALALLVGAIQATTGMLRLGFIVNFLSLPVLRGFTAAAAILIMASQLGPLLGLRLPASAGLVPTLRALVEQIAATHVATAGLGLAVVGGLLLMGSFRGRALVVLTVGVVLGHWLALDTHG
ncbi:MAG TPA: SulP family inorganic anion transporter, partial [Nannocystis sp.]